MRVGVAGFSCESCTFSPLITKEKDFLVSRGETLIGSYGFLPENRDANFVPLVRARALPGGPVDRSFYDKFKDELLGGLKKNGPWDGLFLDMHGAAGVTGMDDAEGDLLQSIRQIVGPTCLISASYDLHGNVSHEVAGNLDILTSYRTAPHVDRNDTLKRAVNLLVHCLGKNKVPHKVFIPVPILLPGEQTSTDWNPAAGLYAAIPDIINKYNILDASILIGYAWADEPRATASVAAFGFDRVNVEEAAETLGKRFWERRFDFRFGSFAGTADECIHLALESTEKPVIISDSGDNPTAGAAGDVTYLLERLIAHEVSGALYAGIADPAAVNICERAGPGARVKLDLGGKLDPVHGKPLEVKGDVVSVRSIRCRDGGKELKAVVLRINGVSVVITKKRMPFHHLEDFLLFGVDPRQYEIVVVKIGYLVPGLKNISARSLLALTPGAVNQDIVGLPFRRINRPLYPFDPDMDWQPRIRSNF